MSCWRWHWDPLGEQVQTPHPGKQWRGLTLKYLGVVPLLQPCSCKCRHHQRRCARAVCLHSASIDTLVHQLYLNKRFIIKKTKQTCEESFTPVSLGILLYMFLILCVWATCCVVECHVFWAAWSSRGLESDEQEWMFREAYEGTFRSTPMVTVARPPLP